jgi:hypothetical protein
MEVLLLAIMGVVNIACFMIGAKVGQQVSKGETIKTPTVNPVQAIKERRAMEEAKLEQQLEQDRTDIILRNIEAYDGTEYGQMPVPGRW